MSISPHLQVQLIEDAFVNGADDEPDGQNYGLTGAGIVGGIGVVAGVGVAG